MKKGSQQSKNAPTTKPNVSADFLKEVMTFLDSRLQEQDRSQKNQPMRLEDAALLGPLGLAAAVVHAEAGRRADGDGAPTAPVGLPPATPLRAVVLCEAAAAALARQHRGGLAQRSLPGGGGVGLRLGMDGASVGVEVGLCTGLVVSWL